MLSPVVILVVLCLSMAEINSERNPEVVYNHRTLLGNANGEILQVYPLGDQQVVKFKNTGLVYSNFKVESWSFHMKIDSAELALDVGGIGEVAVDDNWEYYPYTDVNAIHLYVDDHGWVRVDSKEI